MMGGKLFKTRLCNLYMRGRCPRENCAFAHGKADLRYPPGYSNARREYRSIELSDRTDRRYSPNRRFSSGRETRGHRALHNQRPISHDRGYSGSRSPVRRSERRHRKKQDLDGESDDSESFKISNDGEEKKKEENHSSYDEKDFLEIKQIHQDNEMLLDHKSELKMSLDQKVKEEQKLSNRIEDLEMQLNKEQEDCRRIMTKIKKFLRVHGQYMKAQEGLKRSQARLQRLGDQLGSDTLKASVNEDSSVNITSDGEPHDEKHRSPRKNELQSNASIKKRQDVHPATGEEAQLGIFQKRKRFSGMIIRSEKPTKAEGPLSQSENDNKQAEKDVQKSLLNEYKPKRAKVSSFAIGSLDKVKGSEAGHPLPATSMAAHAIDELIEAVEIEEKSEALEANIAKVSHEIRYAASKVGVSYIPPPPLPDTKNAYKQYEGDDEDVEIEMIDIDLNSDVDI